MRTLHEWMRRLRGTLRSGRSDGDLEQELRAHAELAAEDARRRGPDRDAARAARLAAGGTAQAMEALREQRGLPWLDDLGRDLRHGLRSLTRTPVFTAVALLTLALGIGANTAIFSILNGVILRPLGYPDAGRLMYVHSQFPGLNLPIFSLSHPEYVELRTLSRSFSSVGALRGGAVNLTAGERPVQVMAAGVDRYLLDTLRIQPAQGRLFTREEGESTGDAGIDGVLGGTPVAILSHELWRSAFGGGPTIGRSLDINGRSHEVIGIMPPGTDVLDSHADVWLPLGMQRDIRAARGRHQLRVIARLADGVTPEAARAELASLMTNWEARTGVKGHAPSPEEHPIRIVPLQQLLVRDAGRAIWFLQAAGGLVLLVACANLANLVMARAESRRREFGVRAALGAARGRLLRQMLTEGVLVSIAGGAVGVWLALAAVPALLAAHPDSVPRTAEIAIDVPVLLFALVVSVLTGLLFGLAPAAYGGARSLAAALREGGDRRTRGAGRAVRRLLVAAQVALAVVLVVAASLLLRTVFNLTAVDTGFDRQRLVTFSMTLPQATTEPDTRARSFRTLLDALRAIPGVETATAMTGLPLQRVRGVVSTEIERTARRDGGDLEEVNFYQIVMSDYFATMRIPIVKGRGFDDTDIASAEKVVVVNEAMARTVWPGQDPIGRRLRTNLVTAMGAGGNDWHTVIGVAGDVKQQGVAGNTDGELYVLAEQHAAAPPTMHVVLRTAMAPAAVSRTIEQAVRDIDATVPIVKLRDMDAVFAETIDRPTLLARLLGLFAGLALLLATIGTYGVLSYIVAARRREIGVRVALGAARVRIVALVMREGLLLTAAGVGVGVAGAVGLGRLIASLLFGVQPTDIATLAGVATAITLVATFACWLPAWRAARLDPNVVLRAD